MGERQDWHWPIEKRWTLDGIDCIVIRTWMGALNGYARIPEDHPWHGLTYEDPVPVAVEGHSEMLVDEAFDDLGVLPTFVAALGGEEGYNKFTASLAGQVRVHGGLTFAGEFPDDRKLPGWWIGFDTMHAGDAVAPDYLPEYMRKVKEDLGHPLVDPDEHVWSIEEVGLEVARMVDAIKAAERVESPDAP